MLKPTTTPSPRIDSEHTAPLQSIPQDSASMTHPPVQHIFKHLQDDSSSTTNPPQTPHSLSTSSHTPPHPRVTVISTLASLSPPSSMLEPNQHMTVLRIPATRRSSGMVVTCRGGKSGRTGTKPVIHMGPIVCNRRNISRDPLPRLVAISITSPSTRPPNRELHTDLRPNSIFRPAIHLASHTTSLQPCAKSKRTPATAGRPAASAGTPTARPSDVTDAAPVEAQSSYSNSTAQSTALTAESAPSAGTRARVISALVLPVAYSHRVRGSKPPCETPVLRR